MVNREQEALNVLHKMNHQSSGNEDVVDTYLELENLKNSWLSAKNENFVTDIGICVNRNTSQGNGVCSIL